ncbi:predicted protein [Arabidopsis lyrata subsp. lyrata]|uniref:Predicted protein n=1 Tax=Arabidopsis lyrata subsp. lyrata TaxID=81972 RepID=D7KDW9_ARALL|nr:predicted protein [Arabidopsis lyrata subsp. lyrata]
MAPTLQHFFPKVMTLSGSAQGYCSDTLGVKYLNLSEDPCLTKTLVISQGAPNEGQNSTIRCDCHFENNTTCHITRFVLKTFSLPGRLPPNLNKLQYLESIGDIMEIVDPILEGDFNSDEAVRMIKVALVCTNSSPVDDPPPPSSYTLPLSEDDPPPPSSSYTLPLSVDDPSSSSSSYIYSFFLIFLYASLIFLIAIISNSRSILLAIFLNFVCSVKASG